MYRIVWADECHDEMRRVRSFYRPRIRAAVLSLVHQAKVETRNRKRLRTGDDIPAGYPQPAWEIRVDKFRIFSTIQGKTVRILGVKIKGTRTTGEVL